MSKRSAITALVVPLVMTFVGLGWELSALQMFALETGGHVRGMVANPRPLDYVNYDYTPKGHHIELWALRVPTVVTLASLIIAAICGTMFLRRHAERGAVLLWLVVVACIVVVLAVSAYQYVIATNVFI